MEKKMNKKSMGMIILHIEDNLDDHIILSHVFKKSLKINYKLLNSKNGIDGLEKIQNEKIDLILLDYRLPDMSGLEFLEKMHILHIKIPVIFVTGMGSEKIAVEAMKKGVKDYISKDDIETNQFIESVRNLLTIENKKDIKKSDEIELIDKKDEEFIEKLKLLNIISIKEDIKENEKYYVELENIKEEYKNNEIDEILNRLIKKGYILGKNNEKLIICPNCNRIQTSLRKTHYICPNCESNNIERKDYLEHVFCGYIGEEKSFKEKNILRCPNCNLKLGIDKKNDEKTYVKKIGSNFVCNNCGNKFSKPNVVHYCEKCNEKISYKNMKDIILHEYMISEEILN
jgi:FixJ family two-component response regulator/Zn finger protein HypA/HybF involved in hydrogenase expression